MTFDENDIEFYKLSPNKFEEACFDLLLCLGYKNLIWREGGADSGRDIEGRQLVENTLVGSYNEKWFFECKRYEKGVPPEELNPKIAWADAEKPNHLVLLISSYLTNNARNWLEKIAMQKPYTIHIVEGKVLKKLMIRFPDIVSRYFLNHEMKLLLDTRRSWLNLDLLPEPQTLNFLVKKLDFNKVSIDDLAFLWCSIKLRHEEIDLWLFENDETLLIDFMFQLLADSENFKDSVVTIQDDIIVEEHSIGSSDWEVIYNKQLVASLMLNSSTKPLRAMYTFVRDSKGEGLEVLVEATGDFRTNSSHKDRCGKRRENSYKFFN